MNKGKTLKIQYIILQAVYFVTSITIFNYASNMLLFKGYSNTKIGIIISIASLFSIIFQPIVADFADKSKKLNVTQIMLILTGISLLLTLPLYFISQECLLLSIVFITISCLFSVSQPLINVLDHIIDSVGVDSDYGFARSFGSLSFALFNAIFGIIINKYTDASIALITMATYALLFFSVLAMTSTFKKINKVEKTSEVVEETSTKEFIVNNKKMVFLFIAAALFNFSATVMDYNLIQIITPLGGTTVDQGYLGFVWAILEVPVMMSFSRLNKKFSLESLLIFASIIYSIRAVGIYLSNSMLWIYLSLSLQWGSFALFQPAVVEYIDTHTKENEKTRGQALYTTILAIGTMIINFISGFIIDGAGIKTLLLVGSIISIVGTIMFTLVIKKAS